MREFIERSFETCPLIDKEKASHDLHMKLAFVAGVVGCLGIVVRDLGITMDDASHKKYLKLLDVAVKMGKENILAIQKRKAEMN